MFLEILVFYFVSGSVQGASECLHRDYGNTGTVCVCNSIHCDTIDPITQVEVGQYVSYTSNLAGKRFEREVAKFVSSSSAPDVVIDHGTTYQTVHGFGGAFTDATGININSLNNQTREYLMRSYFSNEGLEYSLCRVPIGGTDFSTRSYSYMDTALPDLILSAFALQSEDFFYKIPLIKQAQHLMNGKLQFIASAWTAPSWMKTNGLQDGSGDLDTGYWQLWVNYFIRFLDSYKEQGIEFWGLTTGNEPSLSLFSSNKINSVGWAPWTQNKWIRRNLGPTIRNSRYSNLKLICHDDQRVLLPLIDSLFADKEAREYIDGIGVHWYWNDITPASWQSDVHNRYPEKFFINTEACKGDKLWEKPVLLGSWLRGEKYAIDIIENLQHWSVGWIDWNMALINTDTGEFLKQPMFYAIGHYSKFITRGSIRVDLSTEQNGILLVAFDRPDGATVVVAINGKELDTPINIQDPKRGYISQVITAKSFNTIIYW
ncbi:hypothetical protein Trydic_g11681 [Trypoxylus dichotomus]